MTPELLASLVAGLATLVTAVGAVLGRRATLQRAELDATRDELEAVYEDLAAERTERRAADQRSYRLERALDRNGIPDPDEPTKEGPPDERTDERPARRARRSRHRLREPDDQDPRRPDADPATA